MSLLQQMQPSASERWARRNEPRKYFPSYNLCKHIDVPELQKLYDPKPPPFQLNTFQAGSTPSDRTYDTPYGHLKGCEKDQFARHYQWKTSSQLNYVNHNPPFPAPEQRLGAYHTAPDMVKARPKELPAGQDFQRCGNNLPESKAWRFIDHEYRRFPDNTFPPQKRVREVKHYIGGRSDQDYRKVRENIRELVQQGTLRNHALNPQYRKPEHFKWTGIQDEVRPYEELKKDPERDIFTDSSTYQVQYNRYIPDTEYGRPKHGGIRTLSSSVVRTFPYNHFNRQEYKETYDYLPMPWTFGHKTLTDYRLVDGYKL